MAPRPNEWTQMQQFLEDFQEKFQDNMRRTMAEAIKAGVQAGVPVRERGLRRAGRAAARRAQRGAGGRGGWAPDRRGMGRSRGRWCAPRPRPTRRSRVSDPGSIARDRSHTPADQAA